MAYVISPESIKQAILSINQWHTNTPLILVFSKQKPGEGGGVNGGAAAVRDVYDSLFNLEQIGIADDARQFYLHMCHGQSAEFPYAIRKPTSNYGKTHQRIIKDTFGQNFLTRITEGKYILQSNFASNVLTYLSTNQPIDLKPLVLFHYWTSVGSARTVEDLWKRFSESFGVDQPPFTALFTCSGCEEELPLIPEEDFDKSSMKQLLLPDEYGSGDFNPDFWNRFRTLLERRFRDMKWQGITHELSSSITSALMHDQSLFLLGPPGTGKTTIVTEAILPALRDAYGRERQIKFAPYSLTPRTTDADLFGFQGLDGQWIMGPLGQDMLIPYSDDQNENSQEDSLVPRLVFLDEANRVDIEALLSPVQAGLDRLQKRMEPPVIALGKSQYTLPKRIWRIYAGNSPAADIGRREQSRPFKRRITTVVPPDPLDSALQTEAAFRGMAMSLLEKATRVTDAEINGPATALFGKYHNNSAPLEDLRLLLIEIRKLPRIAVSVGLVEAILLRTAGHYALGTEAALDAALVDSLLGLISGDKQQVEFIRGTASNRNFGRLARNITDFLLAPQQTMSTDIDAIL